MVKRDADGHAVGHYVVTEISRLPRAEMPEEPDARAMLRVQICGMMLQNLKLEPRNDWRIVLAAVEQDWRALELTSDYLKGDEGIVFAAVCQNALALKWASNNLRQDKQFVLSLVNNDGKGHGEALEYASADCKADIEIVSLTTK
jgi:hypothetical protein